MARTPRTEAEEEAVPDELHDICCSLAVVLHRRADPSDASDTAAPKKAAAERLRGPYVQCRSLSKKYRETGPAAIAQFHKEFDAMLRKPYYIPYANSWLGLLRREPQGAA